MGGTFAHIEAYGISPSRRKKNGRSLDDVVRECARQPHYCDHVAKPKPPLLLYGCPPETAAQVARERAAVATDTIGRTLRRDALIFLAGVASYPFGWKDIQSEENKLQLKNWTRVLLNYLKNHYGSKLHYVLMHSDESHPHLHWCALPELENSQLRIEMVHPGRRAEVTARAKGENNRSARKAYIGAMKSWLDDIHLAVYAPFGIARYGPRRQRLSQIDLRQREEAERSLARTLATSNELKEKWRTDIEAEVRQSVLLDINRLEAEVSQQKYRAEKAEAQLHELTVRMAELEQQLSQNDVSKGFR